VCPNKNDVCSLCHCNSHQISGCGLEFKHQRVAPQAHFVVEQSSSLSEGALSALGGAAPAPVLHPSHPHLCRRHKFANSCQAVMKVGALTSKYLA
jgi:hypothetical protein